MSKGKAYGGGQFGINTLIKIMDMTAKAIPIMPLTVIFSRKMNTDITKERITAQP